MNGFDGAVYNIQIDATDEASPKIAQIGKATEDLARIASESSTSFERSMGAIRGSVDSLGGVSTKLAVISGNVQTLAGEMGTLSTKFGTLGSTIGTFGEKVGTAGSGFETFTTQVKGVGTALDALAGNLDTFGGSLSKLGDSFKTVQSGTRDAVSSLGGFSQALYDTGGKIDEFGGTVAGLRQDFVELSDEIQASMSQIAKSTGAFADVERTLNSFGGTLEKLQGQMQGFADKLSMMGDPGYTAAAGVDAATASVNDLGSAIARTRSEANRPIVQTIRTVHEQVGTSGLSGQTLHATGYTGNGIREPYSPYNYRNNYRGGVAPPPAINTPQEPAQVSRSTRHRPTFGHVVNQWADLGIGAGAVSGFIGYDAVKQEAQYQQAMARLQSAERISNSQLSQYNEWIQQNAVRLGEKPLDLAKSFYWPLGSGIRDPKVVEQMVAYATMGAQGDMAAVPDIAKALAGSYRATGGKLSIPQLSDLLFTGVTQSRGTYAELAKSMPNAMAMAPNAGATPQEVVALYDVLTNRGFTPQRSGMWIAAAERQLTAPNAVQEKAAETLWKLEGRTGDWHQAFQGDFVHRMQTLTSLATGKEPSLHDLVAYGGFTTEATAKAEQNRLWSRNAQLRTLFGNANVLGLDLAASQNNWRDLRTDLYGNGGDITGTANAASSRVTQSAFNRMAQTDSFQFKQADIALNEFLITLGQKLAPAFLNAARDMQPLLKTITDWTNQHPTATNRIVEGGILAGGAGLALKGVGMVGAPLLSTARFLGVGSALSGLGGALGLTGEGGALAGLFGAEAAVPGVGWLAGLLTAGGLGAGLLGKHWYDTNSGFRNLVQPIGNGIGAFGNWMGSTGIPQAGNFMGFLGQQFNHPDASGLGNLLGGLGSNLGSSGAAGAMGQIGNYLFGSGSGAQSGLMKQFDDLKAKAQDAVQSVVKEFQNLPSQIGDKFGQLGNLIDQKWDEIKSSVAAKIDEIKSGVSSKLDALGSTITSKWDGFKGDISSSLSAIGSAVSGKWDDIKSSVSSKLAEIGSAITSKWDGFTGDISSALSSAESTVTAKWNSIKSTTASDLSAIGSAISSKWDGFKSDITSVLSGIASTVTSKWSAIKSTTTSDLAAIGSAIQSKWTEFKATIGSVLSAIASDVQGKWDGLKSVTSSSLSAMGLAIESKWNEFKSIIGSALSAITGDVSSAWGQIVSTVSGKLDQMASTVSSKLNEIKGDVSSFVSNTLSDLGGMASKAVKDGASFVSSLASGIKSKEQELADALSGAVKTAVNDALKYIEQHNPFDWLKSHMPSIKLPFGIGGGGTGGFSISSGGSGAFGLASTGAVFSSTAGEASLLGGHTPIADLDYLLPYGSRQGVTLPGGKDTIYQLLASFMAPGIGGIEEFQKQNGGRFAFLHLSQLAAPGTYTGGQQVGVTGWPTNPAFGNGVAGPGNAQLCVVYDASGNPAALVPVSLVNKAGGGGMGGPFGLKNAIIGSEHDEGSNAILDYALRNSGNSLYGITMGLANKSGKNAIYTSGNADAGWATIGGQTIPSLLGQLTGLPKQVFDSLKTQLEGFAASWKNDRSQEQQAMAQENTRHQQNLATITQRHADQVQHVLNNAGIAANTRNQQAILQAAGIVQRTTDQENAQAQRDARWHQTHTGPTSHMTKGTKGTKGTAGTVVPAAGIHDLGSSYNYVAGVPIGTDHKERVWYGDGGYYTEQLTYKDGELTSSGRPVFHKITPGKAGTPGTPGHLVTTKAALPPVDINYAAKGAEALDTLAKRLGISRSRASQVVNETLRNMGATEARQIASENDRHQRASETIQNTFAKNLDSLNAQLVKFQKDVSTAWRPENLYKGFQTQYQDAYSTNQAGLAMHYWRGTPMGNYLSRAIKAQGNLDAMALGSDQANLAIALGTGNASGALSALGNMQTYYTNQAFKSTGSARDTAIAELNKTLAEQKHIQEQQLQLDMDAARKRGDFATILSDLQKQQQNQMDKALNAMTNGKWASAADHLDAYYKDQAQQDRMNANKTQLLLDGALRHGDMAGILSGYGQQATDATTKLMRDAVLMNAKAFNEDARAVVAANLAVQRYTVLQDQASAKVALLQGDLSTFSQKLQSSIDQATQAGVRSFLGGNGYGSANINAAAGYKDQQARAGVISAGFDMLTSLKNGDLSGFSTAIQTVGNYLKGEFFSALVQGKGVATDAFNSLVTITKADQAQTTAQNGLNAMLASATGSLSDMSSAISSLESGTLRDWEQQLAQGKGIVNQYTSTLVQQEQASQGIVHAQNLESQAIGLLTGSATKLASGLQGVLSETTDKLQYAIDMIGRIGTAGAQAAGNLLSLATDSLSAANNLGSFKDITSAVSGVMSQMQDAVRTQLYRTGSVSSDALGGVKAAYDQQQRLSLTDIVGGLMEDNQTHSLTNYVSDLSKGIQYLTSQVLLEKTTLGDTNSTYQAHLATLQKMQSEYDGLSAALSNVSDLSKLTPEQMAGYQSAMQDLLSATNPVTAALQSLLGPATSATTGVDGLGKAASQAATDTSTLGSNAAQAATQLGSLATTIAGVVLQIGQALGSIAGGGSSGGTGGIPGLRRNGMQIPGSDITSSIGATLGAGGFSSGSALSTSADTWSVDTNTGLATYGHWDAGKWVSVQPPSGVNPPPGMTPASSSAGSNASAIAPTTSTVGAKSIMLTSNGSGISIAPIYSSGAGVYPNIATGSALSLPSGPWNSGGGYTPPAAAPYTGATLPYYGGPVPAGYTLNAPSLVNTYGTAGSGSGLAPYVTTTISQIPPAPKPASPPALGTYKQVFSGQYIASGGTPFMADQFGQPMVPYTSSQIGQFYGGIAGGNGSTFLPNTGNGPLVIPPGMNGSVVGNSGLFAGNLLGQAMAQKQANDALAYVMPSGATDANGNSISLSTYNWNQALSKAPAPTLAGGGLPIGPYTWFFPNAGQHFTSQQDQYGQYYKFQLVDANGNPIQGQVTGSTFSSFANGTYNGNQLNPNSVTQAGWTTNGSPPPPPPYGSAAYLQKWGYLGQTIMNNGGAPPIGGGVPAGTQVQYPTLGQQPYMQSPGMQAQSTIQGMIDSGNVAGLANALYSYLPAVANTIHEPGASDQMHAILDALMKVVSNTGSAAQTAQQQLQTMIQQSSFQQQQISLLQDAAQWAKLAGNRQVGPQTDWAAIARTLGYAGAAL